MLSILLLLATAPQSTIPAMSPAPSPVPGGQGRMRVLGQSGSGCASLSMPANDPNAGNGLLWREGEHRVGHYLLLDSYVGGCPDPMYARYSVPDSNAVGREVGRGPAPSPVIIRRP